MNIKNTIERNDTSAGRIFDLSIQILIVISLLSFSADTIPSLDYGIRRILHKLEVITVIVFTVEYLLRIFVADKKFSFLFSFFGVIDLLAILPFYITTGLDLRSIRALRFLRLFRSFKRSSRLT